MSRFEGKVAVVTGAAKGFGEAIARRFAGEGAQVVVADVDRENGEQVVKELEQGGAPARFMATDVSKSADMSALMECAADCFGGIDVIVNNAGFTHRSTPMAELPERGVRRGVRHQYEERLPLGEARRAPAARARWRGVIVNIASIGGGRAATQHHGIQRNQGCRGDHDAWASCRACR